MKSSPDIKLITPREVKTYTAPGRLRVSRNALALADNDDITGIQLNVIFGIIDALQSSVRYDAGFDFPNTKFIEIRLRRDIVSRHNDPKLILESVSPLIKTSVSFQYVQNGKITTIGEAALISMMEFKEGHYYVYVPCSTLPLFLYAGKTVGFAQIERSIFYSLSLSQKRLYLRLASVFDSRSKTARLCLTVDEMKSVMHLSKDKKFNSIHAKILKPMMVRINAGDSPYHLDIQMISEKGKRGHPAVSEILLTLIPTLDDKENTMEALRYLCSCQNIWRQSEQKPITSDSILERLGGETPIFAATCKYNYSILQKKHKEDRGRLLSLFAYSVRKVLLDDYSIDIYER